MHIAIPMIVVQSISSMTFQAYSVPTGRCVQIVRQSTLVAAGTVIRLR